MNKIHTLLVANRGEIAVRVIRSARAKGIRTVAVFAEADRNAPHVSLADTAVFLGEGTVAQTYLKIDKIIDAMQKTGANAVHPGYGFLSENADFAERVQSEGFIWVGPPVNAMNAMASKAKAKQTLEPKGVPMIPGYHGNDQEDATLVQEGKRIGFPLLVKASAGGGGKGMKVVDQESQLLDAIHAARREAENSFGDSRLLLEKFLVRPRHVEVQILADNHGKVLSLFERDCSVQRRHQKVLEEAPAPELSEETRHAMWQAAETTAREIGYQGAGTVEFILSAQGDFYFLEMNTRLQVEHPVTELITGLDLVSLQLDIAQGLPLAVEHPPEPNGHAMEVRLYAEDPAQNFAPMVGRIEYLDFPTGDGIRVDSGIGSQADVSPYYDPMLAKVIVHGQTRQEALSKLHSALSATRCFGLTTNLEFLRHLTKAEPVHSMNIHTRWLDELDAPLLSPELHSAAGWAALATVMHQLNTPATSAWQRHQGWRMSGQQQWLFALAENEQVGILKLGEVFRIITSEGEIAVEHASYERLNDSQGRLVAQVDGVQIEWDARITDEGVALDNGDRIVTTTWWQAAKAHDHDLEASGHQVAVLPGVVTALHKQEGDTVCCGDKLISFEAMKMETTLLAEVDGVLKSFAWQVGDQIAEGDLLFQVEAEESA